MCVAVYELLIGFLALELALPKEEILKHAFDAISIQSVQKRELFHAIVQALSRQGRYVVS